MKGGIAHSPQASLFTALFSAQRAFLQMASQHAKPAAKDLPQLLQPQAEAIGAIMEAKDKLGRTKEGREWGACLSVLGEGVGAWGWVQVVSRNTVTMASSRTTDRRAGAGTGPIHWRDEECFPVLGRSGHQDLQGDVGDSSDIPW